MAPAGDLLGGDFVLPREAEGTLRSVSPADLEDEIGVFPWSTAHAARAVECAAKALPAWRSARPEERAAGLRRFAERVRARKEELALAIARGIGKPLWEARTEVDAVVAKVEVTLGAGLELVRDRELPALGARIRHRSVGVCAVLAPFNFPAHLPNGHVVPALALGNTVVLKPSERAPEVGELYARCMLEAELPAGVFNMVQGDGAVARALLAQEALDGVMFTGSTRVGSAILAQCAPWPGRMLALELGGKNSALVLEDADLEYAAREIAFSAWVTAGQRCTATSRVLVTPGALPGLLEELARLAREVRVGTPDRDDVLLGPVSTRESYEALRERFGALAGRPGLEALQPCEPSEQPVRGYYLRPGLYVERARGAAGELAREELFGPSLLVQPCADEEEALTLANDTRYGLAAAVFTASEARFEGLASRLAVGLCNWNRGTVGSSSQLPFGGVGASGNHRPAGLYASLYCADPVGELRVPRPSSGTVAGLPPPRER